MYAEFNMSFGFIVCRNADEAAGFKAVSVEEVSDVYLGFGTSIGIVVCSFSPSGEDGPNGMWLGLVGK